MHALEKRRESRPQTAVQLAQELIASVQGRPLTPHSGSTSVSPFYSTPASATPAANPVTGAGLAPTIQMTTPPGISGARPATPAKTRLPVKLGLAVVTMIGVVIVGLSIWARQSGQDAKAPSLPPPPTPPGMAYVPGNEFTMGNEGGDESERPQHKVTMQPFFIDLYEVTCEEYDKFIRATQRQPPATWDNGHYPSGWERRPVTGINWDDANAYAQWAGKRLPTEQEWEFAARGSDGRLYPWGSEWKKGLANAGPAPPGHVVDVGAHSAGVSPFGALDMVGNAWEWTASDFVAYPGGRLPGQATGPLKVIRGGCFLSRPDQATATIRVGWPARGGDEYDNTGFRCAKTLVASKPPSANLSEPKILWANNCDPRTSANFCQISDSLAILNEFYDAVKSVNGTITYHVPNSKQELAAYTVVILDFCFGGANDNSINVIKQYIQEGGSAFIMGGNFCVPGPNKRSTAWYASRLTKDFGVTFTADDDSSINWADSVDAHPVTFNVNRIYIGRHSYLNVSSPSQSIIKTNGQPIAAIYDGTGTFVAVSKENFEWGANGRNEVASSDNFVLWRNSLKWLISQSNTKRSKLSSAKESNKNIMAQMVKAEIGR